MDRLDFIRLWYRHNNRSIVVINMEVRRYKMVKYLVELTHGKGITGTYTVDARNKTEARKVCPNKRKITKISKC